MKKFLVALLVLTSVSSWAQFSENEKEILRFWDGTFAYNELRINEHIHQDNIITIYMSGATLGIGEQMDASSGIWASRDLVRITLLKENCKIDVDAPSIVCSQTRPTLASITWEDTPVTSRTFHGSIENISVGGGQRLGLLSFDIVENDHFKAAADRPTFSFSRFSALDPLPVSE